MNNPGVEPFIPTRAIDVGSADGPVKIFVQPSNPEERRRARYITLSHCWGPREKRPITTTSKNLAQHQQAIQFQDLPKTFQDAVTITRRLGVQYLWIDSLCILQDEDDLTDWEHEARTMGSVYQHSYFTIAATGASDSTQGCFMPRDWLYQHVIPLPSRGEEGLKVALVPHGAPIDASIGPLAQRAWITQEWALPPRIIHYCSDRLIWMCDMVRVAECDGAQSAMDLLKGAGVFRPERSDGYGWAETMLHQWHDIVTAYSLRSLTKITDKLVALQGLVDKVEELTQKSCIFGLWCHRLPEDLLWQRQSIDPPYLHCPIELRDIGIPSWSWASKVGQVFWHPGVAYPGGPQLQPIATIYISKTDRKGLIIRSSCEEIPKIRSGVADTFSALEETGERIGEIWFDTLGRRGVEQSDRTTYYILPLVRKPGTYEESAGLVLSRVADEPRLFQREGVIRHIYPVYFKGRKLEEQVIGLI